MISRVINSITIDTLKLITAKLLHADWRVVTLYRPFLHRTSIVALLALPLLFISAMAEGTREDDFGIIYHDGIPSGADYLYPNANGAVGAFVFDIDLPGWVDFIEFTRVRFYHQEETGRPFKILLIRRILDENDYWIYRESDIKETTCTDCWEEVDLSFPELDISLSTWNSRNFCWGLFVNIVHDDEVDPLDYFSIWRDATIDHPFSSAWFWSLHSGDDYPSHPEYLSESGLGEYLINIYATYYGYSPTGETTFSEIKLMYGDR